MSEREQTEFTRPFVVTGLAEGESRLTIEANSQECERLAQRFMIVSITSLAASLKLRLNPIGEVDVSGRLTAEVVQTCVVSLELVTALLAESFSLRYAPGAREPIEDRSFGVDDEQPSEALFDDTVDLGEMVSQQLALALDPFPRVPGAQIAVATDADSPAAGPFLGLGALKW